jgi:hypothetical protein
VPSALDKNKASLTTYSFKSLTHFLDNVCHNNPFCHVMWDNNATTCQTSLTSSFKVWWRPSETTLARLGVLQVRILRNSSWLNYWIRQIISHNTCRGVKQDCGGTLSPILTCGVCQGFCTPWTPQTKGGCCTQLLPIGIGIGGASRASRLQKIGAPICKIGIAQGTSIFEVLGAMQLEIDWKSIQDRDNKNNTTHVCGHTRKQQQQPTTMDAMSNKRREPSSD